MKYGQFCPVAKATEILGERWTLLVLRELFAGATRYADMQRGLGRISSSVLSARLKTLLEHGIVERLASEDGGWEYRLTECGAELGTVIENIGIWGQRWVRSRMSRDELDVEVLMLYLQRYFDRSAFPQNHGVVGFVFSDLHGALRRWWMLLDDEVLELCSQPPGRPEDVMLTCRLRVLSEIFVGDTTVPAAIEAGRLEVKGSPKLTRNLTQWLRPSTFAAIPPAPQSAAALALAR